MTEASGFDAKTFSWREKNLEQVRDYIFSELVRARTSGARLTVLPALVGLLPLKIVARHGWSFERGMWGLISRHGALLEELLVDWGRDMAANLDMYMCLGSVLVPRSDGIENVAHLFDPDGRVVLRQAQTHTTSWEREWGLVNSTTLEVGETAFGRVGLVIGTDAWYPEVSRILTLKGADVLLAPTALREPYNYWHQVSGMWQEIQQNQVFGIEASLTGTAGRVRFAGRSGVFGPVEITPGHSGYYYQLESATRPGIAIGTFDFPARRRLAEEEYDLLSELNPDLYEKALLAAYEAGRARRAAR